MFLAVISIILFIVGYGDNDWKITISTVFACLALRRIKFVPLPLIAILIGAVGVAVNYPNLNLYFDIAAFILITTITAQTFYYLKQKIHQSQYVQKSISILSPLLLIMGIVGVFFFYYSQAFLLGISLYFILSAISLSSPPRYRNFSFSKFYYRPDKRTYEKDVIDVDYSESELSDSKNSDHNKN